MGLADPSQFRAMPNWRGARRRIIARIRLTNGQGEDMDVMVRDISGRGLSAAVRGVPPAVDEIVSVTLPSGGQVWGMVRWVDRNLFGVEFEAPASPGDGATPAATPMLSDWRG